jgi:predicted enzyme related to lactoylglutathione lyase
MPQPNPVRWFEIYVQDMERAKRFYEEVLDTKLTRLESGGGLEMWAFPSARSEHGVGGALVKTPGVRSGGNSTLVYFGCDDCSVEAGRIAGAGGVVQRDKMSIGHYGFVALALDPDGNLIGLHSLR